MGKIDELIKELCPDGVEYVKLGEICEIYDGTHQTPKYVNEGIPFISVENIQNIYGSQKFISIDDYDSYKVKPQLGDMFMTRIGTIGTCAIVNKQEDIAYYVSLALLRPKHSIVNVGYLKHLIESNIGVNEIRKHSLLHAVPIKINKNDICKIQIPLPPLSIQQQIVEILDTFTDSISNLQEELELREKQMEFYRENLLSFDGEDVEWKSIKDCISSLTTGVNPRQHFVLNSEDSSYHYITGKNINDNKIDVSSGTDKINAKALSLINKRAKLTDDILLFASTGTGTVGRMAYVKQYDNSWTVSETLYIIRTQRLINTKFLMYVLNTWRSKKQYIGRISKGSVPHLKISDLLNVFIPVPSLSRQQEIVDILDTFESMITNIKEEIELRQKQYEYYREKLLTFERKGV